MMMMMVMMASDESDFDGDDDDDINDDDDITDDDNDDNEGEIDNDDGDKDDGDDKDESDIDDDGDDEGDTNDDDDDNEGRDRLSAAMAADNKIHFWRRNAKGPGSLQPIYGARYPPVDPRVLCSFLKDTPKTNAVSVKSKKPATFHEFARSTNDAWDIDDEEDIGFFTPLAHSTSVPAQSHSTDKAPSLKVTDRATDKEPEPGPGDRSEPGSADVCRDQLKTDSESANGRVVKSSSDVQLNSNSERSTLQKQQSLPVRPIIPLVARISDQNASGAPPMTVREKTRLDKFKQLLASPNTDLEDLRKHSWSGIPREVRPVTWRLLSGYLPANMERRELVLKRKREEYFGFIEQYYHSRTDEHHRDTYRQVTSWKLPDFLELSFP
ncbi:hypothetical protein QTP70_030112 [Hemibagrus guttatus]|uniref:Uncharacterized protein n=1 Tax=Hemibagrus guttatus TaxID=175788 RepID=A0AAE0R325_9TELE|nr:hypothetical protein QTP70_030112 [Hemibagrus guttatus]